ncbi:unnamed protein product, partial [Lymnaea stagnalis]
GQGVEDWQRPWFARYTAAVYVVSGFLVYIGSGTYSETNKIGLYAVFFLHNNRMADNRNEAPLIINGYTVLQVKTSERSHANHHLFIKEHVATHQCIEWPQGRTLIVYNVSPYYKEDNMRVLLQGCGDILRVYIQAKPSSAPVKKSSFSINASKKSAQVAYIVFKKASGVKNACKLAYDQIRLMSDDKTVILSGLRAYMEDYNNILDVSRLEKEAEAYMAAYYKRKDESDKRDKEQAGLPDEDGFIKVTRHGKNKGTRRTEETQKKGHDHIQKRNVKNELKDFYTFQFRETKR